jgi:hypothetical protein
MQMDRTLLAGFLLVLSNAAFSQDYDGMELVRNGGFENTSKTPNTYDQIHFADGWQNATLAPCELFDASASPKTVGIPANDYGTMSPQEGERYAGIVGWKDDVRFNMDAVDQEDTFMPGWNSYSEYLMGELIQPLKKGEWYEITFHVALAQNSDRTILGLGAYCWKDPQPYKNRKFMGEVPDVYFDQIIEEKGKWVEVKGTFKARGGETAIVVGVFPYVGLESKKIVEGYDNRYAYYYVDSISVKRVPEP